MSAPRLRSLAATLRWPFVSFGFLPALVTRLVLGHAFYQAGHGKSAEPANTIALFQGLGIPLPAQSVLLVSQIEIVGGLALALGLLTRPVALLLGIVMGVALATADGPRLVEALGPSATFGPTDITPFVFLLLLSWLVAHGAGSLSLDRLLVWAARRLLSTPPPSTPSPSSR